MLDTHDANCKLKKQQVNLYVKTHLKIKTITII